MKFKKIQFKSTCDPLRCPDSVDWTSCWNRCRWWSMKSLRNPVRIKHCRNRRNWDRPVRGGLRFASGRQPPRSGRYPNNCRSLPIVCDAALPFPLARPVHRLMTSLPIHWIATVYRERAAPVDRWRPNNESTKRWDCRYRQCRSIDSNLDANPVTSRPTLPIRRKRSYANYPSRLLKIVPSWSLFNQSMDYSWRHN